MRWFRRIAIGLVIVAVLLVTSLVVLVVMVDPNHYKAPVATAIKERYHRTLRIDGDLKLTVFPRLGVEIEKLSLSEPDSTQVFAIVDTARVSVAVLPLFSRRVVVDHVKVDGLKASVVRYKNGSFNFDDLLGEPVKTRPAGAPAAKPPVLAEGTALQLDVAGIDFNSGELAYRDFTNGVSLRLERLSAKTGRIAPRSPFAVSASARVLGMTPRIDAQVETSANLQFDPATRQYAVRGLDLRASGVLPSVRASSFVARGDAAYDAQRGALDASGVSVVFQGDVAGQNPLTGVDARLEAPRLGISLNDGRLEVDKFTVSAQGKLGPDPFEFSLDAPALAVSRQQASGQTIQGRLRLTGEPAADTRFTLAGVSGSGGRLLIQQLSVNADVRQGARVVKVQGNSPMEANLESRRLALTRVDAQVLIEDPALPGKTMSIPLSGSLRADLAAQTAAVRVDAAIDGDKLNASVDVAQFDEPRVSFALNALRLDLDKLWPDARASAGGQGDASGRAPVDAPVDLSGLQGMTVNGTVKIGSLVARKVHASNVAASLRVAKGRADVSGIRASLYGGTLSGSLFADANTQRIGFSPSLSNVQVQPLLKDLVDHDTLIGRGNVSINATASGKTVQAMKQGLNGTVQWQLRDGAIKGINLAQSLRDFKAMVGTRADSATQADRARQTDFSEMQGQVVFANGVGTVKSLNLKAPLLRVEQGQPARIDAVRSALDLVVRVHVANTSTGQGGKELEQLRNVMIPVHLTGDIGAPAYKIQWSQVGAELLRDNLRSQIDEKLGINDPAQREQLKENVRGRLRELFR